MEINLNENKKMIRAIREGQVVPERSGEFWNEEEREQLRGLYVAGEDISQISLTLRRSELAVIQQLQVLKLLPPPKVSRSRGEREECCLCGRCLWKNCCLKGGGCPHA